MEGGDRALYTSTSAPYAILLIESSCGAALAMLFFFARQPMRQSLSRDWMPSCLRQAWSEHVGAVQISIVLAAAFISAAAIATWAYRRAVGAEAP